MGYDVSPEDISTDETLAAFEESFQNAIENAVEGSIITSGADVVKDAIKAGSVSTTTNSEKQARHIFGSDGYIAGRSYINGTLEDAQMLVDALSGTGEPILVDGEWMHKERVTNSSTIGIHVDQKTKEERETKNAIIIYSKTGSHIVPSRED
ncbi:MAG: polymorphic toxin type 50 domain-containing protein [Candidatus Limivicinus sp.]